MKLAELRTSFIDSALISAASLSSIGVDKGKLIDATMREAVAEFSAAVPRVASKEFTYARSAVTLDDWDAFSRVLSVEGPTGDVPPTYVDQRDVYVDPDTGALGFASLASGTACKARYTALHTIPDSPSGDVTIPTARLKAWLYLVAAMIAEKLAARHAEENHGFQSDVTDHQSKSREYLNLAKEYRRQFRAQVGSAENAPSGPSPAEAVAQFDHPSYRMHW